jgi:hypothetical protein
VLLERHVFSRRTPAVAAPPASAEASAGVAAAPAAPPAPVPSGPLAVEAEASFQDNIFPSLLLSFGSASPVYLRVVSVAVRHAAVGKPYQLRIDCSLFQQPLLTTGTASSENFTLNPELPWNFDALRQSTQLLPQSFVVAVTSAGSSAQTTLTCMVHPVNEVVSRILNPATGEWQDTSICYAAFVNEDHPWIGSLLQEAVEHGGIDRFAGYEFGRRSVITQMTAIWDVLSARGSSYVDLASTSGGVPGLATQYVRFLDQAIRDRGANCVDGSALLASIFRRIGLRPVLLFKPGHCFVAVYDASSGGNLIAVETTLLGSASFAKALSMGSQELDNTLPNINNLGYSAVDIVSARQAGVRPIEFPNP